MSFSVSTIISGELSSSVCSGSLTNSHFGLSLAPERLTTVVLTGTFPEVGGGSGLNLGKDKVKMMIQKCGGRVTSAVSGKTDFVIAGQAPGFKKVSAARSRPHVSLLSLSQMKMHIEGTPLAQMKLPNCKFSQKN